MIHGRDYMYFPPFPRRCFGCRSWRSPIALTGSSPHRRCCWPGSRHRPLCRCWWRVRIPPVDRPLPGRAEAAPVAALIATITSGSVVLLLPCCAVSGCTNTRTSGPRGRRSPGALSSRLLGVLERPSARRVAATGALTLGAALSRTTIGWGCVDRRGPGRADLARSWARRAGPPPVVAPGASPPACYPSPSDPPSMSSSSAHPSSRPTRSRSSPSSASTGAMRWPPTAGGCSTSTSCRARCGRICVRTGLRLTLVFLFLTLPAILGAESAG